MTKKDKTHKKFNESQSSSEKELKKKTKSTREGRENYRVPKRVQIGIKF